MFNSIYSDSCSLRQAGHLYIQMRKIGDFCSGRNPRFSLLVAPAPNPLFRRLHLRLRAVPALFLKHTVRQSRPVSSKYRWRTATVSSANAVSPLPRIHESGAKSCVLIFDFQNSCQLLSAARGGSDLVGVNLTPTKISGSNWPADSCSVSKWPIWPLGDNNSRQVVQMDLYQKGRARKPDPPKMAYAIFFALFAALRSRCIFRWASSLQASQQYLTFFLVAVKAVPQFSQIHSRLLFTAASCR